MTYNLKVHLLIKDSQQGVSYERLTLPVPVRLCVKYHQSFINSVAVKSLPSELCVIPCHK